MDNLISNHLKKIELSLPSEYYFDENFYIKELKKGKFLYFLYFGFIGKIVPLKFPLVSISRRASPYELGLVDAPTIAIVFGASK